MNRKAKDILIFQYTPEHIQSMLNSFGLNILVLYVFTPSVIVYLLFDKLSVVYLFTWLFVAFTLALVRYILALKITKYLNESNVFRTKRYLKYYFFILVVSGLFWGVGISYCICTLASVYIFVLLTFLFALSAGSILTLGSIFWAVFLFNIPMIVLVMSSFLYVNSSPVYILEIIILSIFFLFLLRSSYNKQLLVNENEHNIFLIKQYENITNESSIISKTNLAGVITYVNDNFCKISGYTKNELVGHKHNIIKHPDMPDVTFKDMWHTISKKKETWHGIIKNRAKNGEPYYVSSTVSPILDKHNNIKEYIALRHDISSIMSDKKQLFDYLESNKLSVLIMIQIEDYNTLEKFYDKKTVEEIEKSFGDALLYLFPNPCDFQRVYNLGGGLYALAKDRRTCQKTKEEIYEVLRGFLNNVKDYVITLEKIEYDISAICSYTYGVIQIYEDAKIGIEKAIEYKEDIVYADGLSGIEYAIALQNIETLRSLKVAIDDKKVISYFQPIVNNTSKKVEKYESLVRLINEFGEVISPYQFLEVAKKGRYYTQVTKIVLENSFSKLRETTKDISINLSAYDIESSDMQKYILKLLDEYKDDAKRVVFELLESEDVKDFDAVTRFIKKIKPYGVLIAIDDFGTGYSNFERLLQYEPDLLKIDGSLIKNIENNKLSKNIVETIVLFAKKQNIKTVAEFVENEAIFNIVKELGIDYSQGYAFGKPEEIINFD